MRDFKFKTSRLGTTGLILSLGIALAACSPAKKYQKSNGTADNLGERRGELPGKGLRFDAPGTALGPVLCALQRRCSRSIICPIRRSQTTSALFRKLHGSTGTQTGFGNPEKLASISSEHGS